MTSIALLEDKFCVVFSREIGFVTICFSFMRVIDGLHNPRGFDVAGDVIYVADTGAHEVVGIDMVSGQREVLGGNGARGREWASPWDVAVLPGQKLLVAMAGTHQLRRIDLNTKGSNVFAGNGHENIKDDDIDDAELAQPSGLSLSPDGEL